MVRKNYRELQINAFVDSYDCKYKNRVKLDTLIHEKINFIKMDIEGYEWNAIQGAKNLIGLSKNLKMAICSYHSDFDQTLIECEMDKLGVNHWTSKGYMWFPYKVRQNYISTKLNRAIVYGIK